VSTVRNYCNEPFIVLTVCCTILQLAVRPVISKRNGVPAADFLTGTAFRPIYTRGTKACIESAVSDRLIDLS